MTERRPYVTVEQAIDDLPPVAAGDTHPDDDAHTVCNHRASTVEIYEQSDYGDTPHGGFSPRVCYPDRPCWTVTVSNGTAPIHYDQPRMLTPRELCRLQTIPDWFVLTPESRTDKSRLVGNAVPPDLAESVVETLLDEVQ